MSRSSAPARCAHRLVPAVASVLITAAALVFPLSDSADAATVPSDHTAVEYQLYNVASVPLTLQHASFGLQCTRDGKCHESDEFAKNVDIEGGPGSTRPQYIFIDYYKDASSRVNRSFEVVFRIGDGGTVRIVENTHTVECEVHGTKAYTCVRWQSNYRFFSLWPTA